MTTGGQVLAPILQIKNGATMQTVMLIIMVIIANPMELQQQISKDTTTKTKNNWISVGASIRTNEIDLFNKQLDNLQCQTLKDMCNLLIAGKLRRITDDEQVDIMKVQTQATGLSTAQIGDKFDFW